MTASRLVRPSRRRRTKPGADRSQAGDGVVTSGDLTMRDCAVLRGWVEMESVRDAARGHALFVSIGTSSARISSRSGHRVKWLGRHELASAAIALHAVHPGIVEGAKT